MCRGAATKSVLDQQLTTVLGSREPQGSFRHSDRPPGGSAQKSGRPLLRALHRLTACRRWAASSSRRHAVQALGSIIGRTGGEEEHRAAGRVHLEQLQLQHSPQQRRKRRGAAGLWEVSLERGG